MGFDIGGIFSMVYKLIKDNHIALLAILTVLIVCYLAYSTWNSNFGDKFTLVQNKLYLLQNNYQKLAEQTANIQMKLNHGTILPQNHPTSSVAHNLMTRNQGVPEEIRQAPASLAHNLMTRNQRIPEETHQSSSCEFSVMDIIPQFFFAENMRQPSQEIKVPRAIEIEEDEEEQKVTEVLKDHMAQKQNNQEDKDEDYQDDDVSSVLTDKVELNKEDLCPSLDGSDSENESKKEK